MLKYKIKYFQIIFYLAFVYTYSQESNISFMSYNIRYDNVSDGENAWPNRKENLVQQLKFYEPSIFGTQEGLPHQVTYLNSELTNYNYVGEGRDGGNNGEHSVIFYNKERFQIIKTTTFWLSLTPDVPSKNWDAALPRICTYALFKEKQTGLQFWVFNTHFDHAGQQARVKSADLIIERIASENTDDFPVIFMGDLNSEPQNEVISKLNEELIDTFNVSVTTPFGPFGTFNGFNFNEPVTRKIDYIFVSKSSQIEVIKYAALSNPKNLRYPSDHLPIYVELKIHLKD